MQVRAMYLPPVFYSTTHTCPRMKNILYLGFDRTIHIWKEEEKLVTRSAKHIEIEALLHPKKCKKPIFFSPLFAQEIIFGG